MKIEGVYLSKLKIIMRNCVNDDLTDDEKIQNIDSLANELTGTKYTGVIGNLNILKKHVEKDHNIHKYMRIMKEVYFPKNIMSKNKKHAKRVSLKTSITKSNSSYTINYSYQPNKQHSSPKKQIGHRKPYKIKQERRERYIKSA